MPTDAAVHETPSVLLFDRSDRLRMQFTGPKAAESLTGLVTNDVLSLRGGDGQYACALTNKGRVIADVRIFATESEAGQVTALLVDTGAAAGPGFAAMIRKYVNPRTAKYLDVTANTACLSLLGAGAPGMLHALGADADALRALEGSADFTHTTVSINGEAVRVARVPDLGDGLLFDLFCAQRAAASLQSTLLSAGACASTAAEWHRRRVLAMRPAWGIDMDEGTLAQEANMDALQAISYRKGCYTGQETVARVHFRGHVNRTLRHVLYVDGVAPPAGTALRIDDATEVGTSRSTASLDDGATLGIAMLRREVADAQRLSWTDERGDTHPVQVSGSALD